MSRPVRAIVGAGEGLGRALAARFAGESFDIGLVSRSREGSSAATEAAVSAGPGAKVDFFAADARQPETVEQALNNVASEIGEVEVADPDAVAQACWWAHQQPKSAWSNEIKIRPHTENWTY